MNYTQRVKMMMNNQKKQKEDIGNFSLNSSSSPRKNNLRVIEEKNLAQEDTDPELHKENELKMNNDDISKNYLRLINQRIKESNEIDFNWDLLKVDSNKYQGYKDKIDVFLKTENDEYLPTSNRSGSRVRSKNTSLSSIKVLSPKSNTSNAKSEVKRTNYHYTVEKIDSIRKCNNDSLPSDELLKYSYPPIKISANYSSPEKQENRENEGVLRHINKPSTSPKKDERSSYRKLMKEFEKNKEEVLKRAEVTDNNFHYKKIIEVLYNNYSNYVNGFLTKNRDQDLKLIGNRNYKGKTVDAYLMDLMQIRESDVENLRKKFLTPIPQKHKRLMRNNLEKEEADRVERSAVMMRRVEYSQTLMMCNEENQLERDFFMIISQAATVLQKWWRGYFYSKHFSRNLVHRDISNFFNLTKYRISKKKGLVGMVKTWSKLKVKKLKSVFFFIRIWSKRIFRKTILSRQDMLNSYIGKRLPSFTKKSFTGHTFTLPVIILIQRKLKTFLMRVRESKSKNSKDVHSLSLIKQKILITLPSSFIKKFKIKENKFSVFARKIQNSYKLHKSKIFTDEQLCTVESNLSPVLENIQSHLFPESKTQPRLKCNRKIKSELDTPYLTKTNKFNCFKFIIMIQRLVKRKINTNQPLKPNKKLKGGTKRKLDDSLDHLDYVIIRENDFEIISNAKELIQNKLERIRRERADHFEIVKTEVETDCEVDTSISISRIIDLEIYGCKKYDVIPAVLENKVEKFNKDLIITQNEQFSLINNIHKFKPGIISENTNQITLLRKEVIIKRIFPSNSNFYFIKQIYCNYLSFYIVKLQKMLRTFLLKLKNSGKIKQKCRNIPLKITKKAVSFRIIFLIIKIQKYWKNKIKANRENKNKLKHEVIIKNKMPVDFSSVYFTKTTKFNFKIFKINKGLLFSNSNSYYTKSLVDIHSRRIYDKLRNLNPTLENIQNRISMRENFNKLKENARKLKESLYEYSQHIEIENNSCKNLNYSYKSNSETTNPNLLLSAYQIILESLSTNLNTLMRQRAKYFFNQMQNLPKREQEEFLNSDDLIFIDKGELKPQELNESDEQFNFGDALDYMPTGKNNIENFDIENLTFSTNKFDNDILHSQTPFETRDNLEGESIITKARNKNINIKVSHSEIKEEDQDISNEDDIFEIIKKKNQNAKLFKYFNYPSNCQSGQIKNSVEIDLEKNKHSSIISEEYNENKINYDEIPDSLKPNNRSRSSINQNNTVTMNSHPRNLLIRNKNTASKSPQQILRFADELGNNYLS